MLRPLDAESWEATVRRLDGVASRDPRGYRLRVGLLAALGYAYVWVMIFGLVALAGGWVAVSLATAPVLLKFSLPVFAVALAAARALWVRLPEPVGAEIRREDAPALWEEIESLRRELDAPRIDRLLIDEELNAGVVQIPRFGPVGPPRNFLVLGLPLLEALTREELRAVIAHELGHLSGNHARFAGRIYRLRAGWARLLAELEEKRQGALPLFRRFFEWYAPYFAAYTFPLARQDEYVADHAAAEAAGALPAASALVRLETTARFLPRWWQDLYKRAEREARPPARAFAELREQLPQEEGVEEGAEAALARPTDLTDTHPALSERLAGLGVASADAIAAARVPPPATAAEELLGPLHDALLERFDADWRERVADDWSAHHAELKAAQQRLETLERRGEARTLAEEAELGGLLVDLRDDPQRGLEHLERALASGLEDPVASFRAGAILLERGEERGLERLEAAAGLDPSAVIPACELAYAFLSERDRAEEAEAWARRAQEHSARLDAAAAERADIEPRDSVVPHERPPEVVEQVRAALAPEPAVERAFLVRKEVSHFPEFDPLLVLALKLRRRPFRRGGNNQEVVERVLGRIEIEERLMVLALAGPWRRRATHLSRVPDAEIYRA